MKYTYFSVLLTICCAIAHAQVSIIPVAGLNMSGLAVERTDPSYNYIHIGNRAGFCGGGLVNIPLTKWLSIQPGALYKMNGSRQKDNSTYRGTHEEVVRAERIGTIDLPLKLMLTVRDHRGNKYFVGAGPYFAINIAASFYQHVKTVDAAGNKVGDEEYIYHEKLGYPWSPVSWYDAGAGVSAGYEMRNGIIVCVYAQKGFRTVFESNYSYFSPIAAKNYNYGFMAGYSLKLKKHKTAGQTKTQ